MYIKKDSILLTTMSSILLNIVMLRKSFFFSFKQRVVSVNLFTQRTQFKILLNQPKSGLYSSDGFRNMDNVLQDVLIPRTHNLQAPR